MNDLLEAIPRSEEALLLDPFGVRPQWASRVPGLGGAELPADPSYVFLTHDCRPAIGTVCATVRFYDLAVTRGTLLLEVRVRSAVPGAEPSRLQTVVVNAQELVVAGGVVELSFESYRNAYYAIACSINDETDLTASHILVSLDRRATPAQHGREWEWPGPSSKTVRRRPRIETALIGRSLTDLGPPRLDTPMSQVGSPLQCREPIFVEMMAALQRAPAVTFGNWSLAYVMQAIARFSGTEPGRMLGYGEDEASLMSYFASRQCEVVGMRHATDPDDRPDPGRELQKLWLPELCDEADFFAHAHYNTGDIRQSFETFRDQFDVIWSIGANRVMTPQEFVYFAVNGLTHARPGGLAVHVFDYVERFDGNQGTSLTRHDIERITALALSHHNEVARLQFRHNAAVSDPRTPLPFGLVLLRGGLPRAESAQA
jgi:hypothetical protein